MHNNVPICKWLLKERVTLKDRESTIYLSGIYPLIISSARSIATSNPISERELQINSLIYKLFIFSWNFLE